MTTSAAIRFIEALAAEHALRERLRTQGRGIRLEDVCILAAEADYYFTASELRRAFVQDWHMRRRFFSAAARADRGPADPARADRGPADPARADPGPADAAAADPVPADEVAHRARFGDSRE